MRTSDAAQLCNVSARTIRRLLALKDAPRLAVTLACIAQATGADLMQIILGEWKKPRPRKYSGRRGNFLPRKRAVFPARKSSV